MYKIKLEEYEAVAIEGMYNWALFGGVNLFESAGLDLMLHILQQLVEQGYKPTLPRIIEGFREP